MKIRNLKKSDIERCSKIVGQNYSKKYEELSFLELEASFKNYVAKPKYIVAEEKGMIIGFGGYVQSWMDYNIYEIFWVNISPANQGIGIGSALVEKLIHIIKKKNSSAVILLTTQSPGFYSEKFHFKILSILGGKSGVLMSLNLKEI